MMIRKCGKIICIILIVCLMFTTLAACGGDNGYSKEGRLVIWKGGDNGDDVFTELAKDFTAETGIEVIVKSYVGLSAADKLALDGPFGKGGDIYQQGGGGDLCSAIEKGIFMEIPPESIELNTKFVESAKNTYMYKGKNYGIPWGLETNAIIYNKDLIQEIPDTFDEFIELAKGINNFGDNVPAKEEKYGFLIDTTNPYFTHAFTEAYGGYIFGKDSGGNWNIDDIGIANEGAIKAVELLRSLITGGVMPAQMPYTLQQTKFKSGKVAAIYDGPWSIPMYQKAGINVGVAKIPKVKLSNGDYSDPITFSSAYGLTVSSYTKNPELSIQFLNFASQDKYLMQYYDESGRIPALTSCETNPAIADSDIVQGFYSQLDYSFPQPNVNELTVVWDPLKSALQEVYVNNKDIKTMLESALNVIKNNISLIS